MKAKYIKKGITSLVLVAAMALPMAAMAAETPDAPDEIPTVITQPVEDVSLPVAVDGMARLTEAEKQEFDDACRKLTELEAELDRLIQNDEFGAACNRIEEQMAPLRVRIVELGSKAFFDSSAENDAPASFEGYADELDLTDTEKQELNDALRKLAELQAAADEGEDVDRQMAELEARIAELENKAFPDEGDDEIDSASYEDYANSLELTETEKEELVAALRAGDSDKIAVLELKAFANSTAKTAGDESQEYLDLAKQAGDLALDMIRLITSGASEEQIDQISQKLELLCDRMAELNPAA